jgi:DNA-binding transcriptional ArsR family regulator
MVIELLGGEALPVAALARAAGVAASTASGHVARLEQAGLVTVRVAGRERLVALAGHEVAEAVEALTLLGGEQEVRSLRAADRLAAERAARSCYDHLAGRLGVGVCEGLCAAGVLERGSLALRDPVPLERLGVDVDAARAGRRALTRTCLDWSERRPHLAGALGAALLRTLLERGWVARRPVGRALRVTPAGHEGLERELGLDAAHLAATHGGRAV